MNTFRTTFSKLRFNWQTGLFFIVLLSVPRFWIVLKANQSGNYNFTSLVFVIMILLPFVLLTRKGRERIGFSKPTSWKWVLAGFGGGMLVCGLMFLIGQNFEGISNWFVYISQSFSAAGEITQQNRFQLFMVFALVSISFSPLGEEFFYRGFIHECFVEVAGHDRASMIDSIAFALVHLSHFGIIYKAGWQFLPVPASLWVVFMYFTCRLFFVFRQQSGSIIGAIVAHAGFNLAMTYFIFYHIL